jgi:hypothetical protein
MSNLTSAPAPTFDPVFLNADFWFTDDDENQSSADEEMFLANIEKYVADDMKKFVAKFDQLALFDRARFMFKTLEALDSMI